MSEVQENKKQINWILIISIALISLILLVVGSLYIYYKTSFSIYVNEKAGLEIPYPKGWTVMENPLNVKDAIVVFVSPKSHALDTVFENIVVTTVDQSQNPLSVNDFGKLTREQTTAVFGPATKVISSGPTKIAGGRPAYRHAFYLQVDQPMAMIIYQFMFNPSLGYNMMYYGDVSTYEAKYKLKFDLIARNMKIFF